MLGRSSEKGGLNSHQEDQEVQKQRVEEADGAGHLVGENQPPLGSTQGVSGVGRASPTPAGLTHPRRAHPPLPGSPTQGSKGRERQAS